MATYTTQLRTIIDSDIEIFDFEYDLFDPDYKPVLEQKFKDRFLFREIGLETVGQFKHFLKVKFQRILPRYNQHYKVYAEFETYDPFKNKDVTQTDTRTSTTDGTATNTRTDKDTLSGKDVFSDNPQTRLSGNEDYATTMTENDHDSTSTSDGSSTNNVSSTDEYVSNLKGHDGMKYPAGIMKEVRDNIIGIDDLLLDECEDLFMNIW